MGNGVLAPELPPPYPSAYVNLRFYQAGTATANFVDNGWAFQDPSQTVPTQAWSQSILVRATTADLYISFDGENVHGRVPAGSATFYQHRFEGGIYVRGTGSVFEIEAW